MRLWTLHPQYLDPQGLVALWRESLLAQRVLQGRTRGYRNHPQLIRFAAAPEPQAAMSWYLREIVSEADRRGYSFNASLIAVLPSCRLLQETQGQLDFEWQHLKSKLSLRSPAWYAKCKLAERPEAHPLFSICPGPVRDWEKAGISQARLVAGREER